MSDRPPQRIVICGTDTDVGKTYVGVRLVRALRDAGRSVGVLKPIESGAAHEDGTLRPADALALADAAGVSDVRTVCPWPLPLPVAPAAELTRLGMRVKASEIREAVAVAEKGQDVLVVETAGGILSPITPALTSVDLATLVQADVVLVTRSRLGVISHTATAVEILRDRGASVRAVVLNEADEGPDHDLNAEWIDRAVPEVRLVRFRGDASELSSIFVDRRSDA